MSALFRKILLLNVLCDSTGVGRFDSSAGYSFSPKTKMKLFEGFSWSCGLTSMWVIEDLAEEVEEEVVAAAVAVEDEATAVDDFLEEEEDLEDCLLCSSLSWFALMNCRKSVAKPSGSLKISCCC